MFFSKGSYVIKLHDITNRVFFQILMARTFRCECECECQTADRSPTCECRVFDLLSTKEIQSLLVATAKYKRGDVNNKSRNELMRLSIQTPNPMNIVHKAQQMVNDKVVRAHKRYAKPKTKRTTSSSKKRSDAKRLARCQP